MRRAGLAFLIVLMGLPLVVRAEAAIPRPEHPRPDAVRPHWANLNGRWQFRFDPKDEGNAASWFEPGAAGFDREIVVPFGWESALSEIHDKSGESKIGWYRRSFTVPASFPKDQRVRLRFEAVDWRADVWVNGKKVATHEGGYSPFEADITEALKRDGENVLVVRAFDATDPSLPTGKQVGWYTPTSGIWQTVWLEARPEAHIGAFTIHTPSLDPARIVVDITPSQVGKGPFEVTVQSDDATVTPYRNAATNEADRLGAMSLSLPVRDPKLWTPETPHLYPLTITMKAGDGATDTIKTYAGLRTLGRGKLPGEDFERVLLNGKPIYLRGALDQSFNPQGVYTAPSDAFLKNDIALAKEMGLNFLRIHIKPDEPRRLYWADKLGLLIMEDMPNTWKQNETARAAWESTMREVVARDRNHPAIFAWVAFNETWGLSRANDRGRDDYKSDKDTQEWVKRMVGEVRKLDPGRLVEDNSPCYYDHVGGVTDLNSWHFYIDDHAKAREHLDNVVARSKEGSDFNHCPGETMNSAPLINSEYGAVSAGGGDRDISWGFRDLTTQLRKHNKVQGYIYTELADIEWEHNGFVNYDRTPKVFGYDAFLPDMRVNEMNQPDFVGFDAPPAIVAKPGETIKVPVFISHYSDRDHPVALRWWVQGWDHRADEIMVSTPKSIPAKWKRYDVTWQEPITVKLPDEPFVGALILTLRDEQNHRFASNFVNVVVKPDRPLPRVEREGRQDVTLRFAPDDYAASKWSAPASPPEGKVYGRGKGFFEYHIRVPKAVVAADPDHFQLRFELASKAGRERVDWPERVNKQDYPQTDGREWPTEFVLSLNGRTLTRDVLENDWADARGVLSHIARVEHGSHGDLVDYGGELPEAVRKDLRAGKPLVIRLEVPEDAKHAGGLTVFGATTGQYPFDPTIEIHTANPLPADLGVKPDDPVAVDRAASRRVVLVPSGERAGAGGAPAVWAYTTSDPGAGWNQQGFDDSAWQRGPAGFGTKGTPSLRIGTRWDSQAIWLRYNFDLPTALSVNDDRLMLRLFHDEDARVFVNGALLQSERGYSGEYQDTRLDPALNAHFKPGRNTIAVSCKQTAGGQGIDLGLVLRKAADQ